MYRHHKRHVRLCLTNKPKLAKLKKSRNTVTAVGHFTSWVAEILIFGLLQFTVSANQESLPLEFEFITWIILRVYRHSINYSIFPMVQCVTSKDLRAFVFNFSESCSCVKCSTGQGEDFVPVPNQNNNWSASRFKFHLMVNAMWVSSFCQIRLSFCPTSMTVSDKIIVLGTRKLVVRGLVKFVSTLARLFYLALAG